MLSAKDISKTFGKVKAVAGFTMDVNPGEVVGLLGPNGAGKTTILRMLAGILTPDNGTVEVAEAAAELSEAGKLVSVAGGGDTVAALNVAGAAGRLTYVSTAGGAFLEWLEGKALPGVEVLRVK